MSQQTTMPVVVARFKEFVRALPSVHALAGSSDDELRRLWAGLGYYSRVRCLRRAAEIIVNERAGAFPTTYADWRQLPGCGPYTAAMVASVCFGERVPAIDGNVIRVMSRVLDLGERTWLSAGQNAILDVLNASIAQVDAPGIFNEAMIELGALVCRKQKPRCSECPLASTCRARANGHTETTPPPRPRRAAEDHALTALVAMHEGRVAILARSEGFLSSTRGFPLMRPESCVAFTPERVRVQLGPVRHTITHHRLAVHITVLDLTAADLPAFEAGLGGALTWEPAAALPGALETSLDRKVWTAVKAVTAG